MKYFISLQKKKGLYATKQGGDCINEAHRLNHELMGYGFVMSKALFDVIAAQTSNSIAEIYNDLISGLAKSYGGDGYQPIYKNFPQSVKNISYEEFYVNAILYYWSNGTWSPDDSQYIQREYKIEPIKYKELALLTEKDFNNIYYDIVYANSSISSWDKEIVCWFLENTSTGVNLSKIKFKETLAFVANRMLDNSDLCVLPVASATDVLRIVSAYCGGDEGLKENTKFKKFKKFQQRILLDTLNKCYDLEESFKQYREKWLRLLFYLNPNTREKAERYPIVAKYAYLLRNNPKTLKTFNSYVEEYIKNGDIAVFDLLQRRMGAFTRRLDSLIRKFGVIAFDKYIESGPNLKQRIEVYNHFFNRDQEQEGRTAILASANASNIVNYQALEPLDFKLVAYIRTKVLKGVKTILKNVYIDPSLYYRPMDNNTRANGFSIVERAKGTVERIENIAPGKNVVRCFVHWQGTNDIDLSAMLIDNSHNVAKVGWNGDHALKGITYSGDNTGTTGRNAEYIDVDFESPGIKNLKWILLDARVYRGSNYADWNKEGVYAGWELRQYAEANQHWIPENLSNVSKIKCNSEVAYLLALHVPTKSIVYLDVSCKGTNITTKEDALKMETYLDKYLYNTSDSGKIYWDMINQGHILHLISENIVDTPEQAEHVFDKNTTWESVAKYI